MSRPRAETFEGEPCSKGHTERYSSGRCAGCAREQANKYHARRKARTDLTDHRDPDTVAEGFGIRKTSSLRRVTDPKTGETFLQWQMVDREKYDLIAEIVEAFEAMPELIPQASLIEPPDSFSRYLMNVIPIGDPHFGMYAWAEECGEDFDLKIAERNMLGGAADLFGRAPWAQRCLLINLGDMHHANDSKAVTPQSGHRLDVDSRFPKVLQTTIRVCCAMTELALEKHEHVEWWHEPGNHDPEAAVALACAMQQRYWANPRVTVQIPTAKYRHMQWGQCMIASSHGDKCKPSELREYMITDAAEVWGRTVYRHGYLGHRHQWGLIEQPGVVVETMRTLAAKDSHAAGHARYRSDRDIRLHTWHRDEGLIRQEIVNVRTIERRMAA